MVKFKEDDANNPKIAQILEAGRALFWKFGIRRVSIEEVCRTAEVSKVTFYKYFDNKTDLAIHLLDNVYRESLMVYRELMNKDIPFEEKVRETIRMKMEGTQELSNELIEDILTHPDEEIKKYYGEIASLVLQEVVQGYAEAQKKGEVRPDIKVEFMLFFMGHMMELAKDERLLGLYGNSRDVIMELLNFFFYGIMPREKTKNKSRRRGLY